MRLQGGAGHGDAGLDAGKGIPALPPRNPSALPNMRITRSAANFQRADQCDARKCRLMEVRLLVRSEREAYNNIGVLLI
jgi:hypothetical protein